MVLEKRPHSDSVHSAWLLSRCLRGNQTWEAESGLLHEEAHLPLVVQGILWKEVLSL
jgi:hypothetical protein